MAKALCECSDPGCPVHFGSSTCPHTQQCVVFRVDMEDETGIEMCELCAEDALSSGCFSDEYQEEDEDDY